MTNTPPNAEPHPRQTFLDRLEEALTAEAHRPRWKTGAETGRHAPTVLLDCNDQVRAITSNAGTAETIAEAMTVLSRIEDDETTETALAAQLVRAERDRDAARAAATACQRRIDELELELVKARLAADTRGGAPSRALTLARQLAHLLEGEQ